MSAFADALSALATAVRTDDLPEPVSASWMWAPDGYRLRVDVKREHLSTWLAATVTPDGPSKETWGNSNTFNWGINGTITGTDVPITLTTILTMTDEQAKVRQCLGAAGNPISVEETLNWWDAFSTLSRRGQLAEHALMVLLGAPASLLPKVVCEFCPEMVEPAGQEAICGECAARKVRA